MAHFQPRHPECRDCKFFKPLTGSVHCLPCGAGENFEERIRVPRQPTDGELMEMYAHMDPNNDDGIEE